jgi:hypothetical protein
VAWVGRPPGVGVAWIDEDMSILFLLVVKGIKI